MLQLAIINNGVVNTSIHYREIRDHSAACYLIKRSWAERLVSKHIKDDKYIISGSDRTRLVPDGIIYHNAICLSFPLFTYSISLGSSLNPDHIETMHTKSRNEVLDFWKTQPKELYKRLK
jgi:hypothetical protein